MSTQRQTLLDAAVQNPQTGRGELQRDCSTPSTKICKKPKNFSDGSMMRNPARQRPFRGKSFARKW